MYPVFLGFGVFSLKESWFLTNSDTVGIWVSSVVLEGDAGLSMSEILHENVFVIHGGRHATVGIQSV